MSDSGHAFDPAEPTSVRVPLLPWADMQALNVPETWAEISRAVMPVLAALTAQGSDRARLLKADQRGFLQAAIDTQAVDFVIQGQAAHDGSLVVADGTRYMQGQRISLVAKSGGAFSLETFIFEITGITGNVLLVAPQLPIQIDPQSLILTLPIVQTLPYVPVLYAGGASVLAVPQSNSTINFSAPGRIGYTPFQTYVRNTGTRRIQAVDLTGLTVKYDLDANDTAIYDFPVNETWWAIGGGGQVTITEVYF